VGISTAEHERTDGNRQAPESISRAIESNLADYWARMGSGPNGRVHISNELSWEYSGGPYLNRVFDVHLSPTDVDARIEEVKRAFEGRRAAITWLLGPSATPTNLGDHLVGQGFVHADSWIGMAHSLASTGARPSVPEGAEIGQVRTWTEEADWIEVVGRSYRLPRAARRSLLACLPARGESPDAYWQHFLVRVDGRPAAASTIFVKNGVAGIYLVSTIPELRGMGLGSLVTRHAMVRAAELGCRLAVLQSTGSAQRMYQRLGFTRHCTINVYRYDARPAGWKRLARSGMNQLRDAMKRLPRTPQLKPIPDGRPVFGKKTDQPNMH
jgi:ribosomal protein S18 acetylase RimI-like enzyme